MVAAAAEAVKRPADLLARCGGEEFAVTLSDTNAAGARKVIEHIYAAIKEKAIGHKRSDVSGVITISACITTCCAETPDLIIELADQALYRAKARGRDCYILEPTSPLLEG